MQAAAKAGTADGDAALEMIARLTLLQDLFSKMHRKGWENLTYNDLEYIEESSGMEYISFDFYARKRFTGRPRYYWNVYGWMEPYLSLNDVDRILGRIEKAMKWFEQNPSTIEGRKRAIVQVLDKYDSQALANLCSRVSSKLYGVPVVVIANGQVACHSRDVDDQGAQNICEQMGKCEGSTPSGSGSDNQGSGDNQDPPDGTYSIPIGAPDTGGCPAGQTICLI